VTCPAGQGSPTASQSSSRSRPASPRSLSPNDRRLPAASARSPLARQSRQVTLAGVVFVQAVAGVRRPRAELDRSHHHDSRSAPPARAGAVRILAVLADLGPISAGSGHSPLPSRACMSRCRSPKLITTGRMSAVMGQDGSCSAQHTGSTTSPRCSRASLTGISLLPQLVQLREGDPG